MRINTYGRYGVRSMFDLAMYRNSGPISLKTISRRQGISIDYLEQIMGKLRRAGLVRSIRGPKGGFVIDKDPKDIRVSDILSGVGECFCPVDCVKRGKLKKEQHCGKVDKCIAYLLWQRLADKIKEYLDSVTLEDLCLEAKDKWGTEFPDHQFMYYL